MRISSSDASTHLLERINSYLYQQIDEQVAQAEAIHPNYGALWSELASVVKAGGKRLRPQLLLYTYQGLGGRDLDTALPIAAMLELFHISILIHDDIIDRDDVRHGVDNLIGIYKTRYQSLISDSLDRQHFAESAALLAGDALLSKAYALLAEADIEPAIKTEVTRQFYRAVFSVAGGELLDTEAAFVPVGSIPSAVIIQQKTASYSFAAPMLMGAALVQAEDATITLLNKLGTHLGTAFQLHDDYESVFGKLTETGKPLYGDLREGKRTRLVEAFYQLGDPKQVKEFETYFGTADLDDEQARRLQIILCESGAVNQLQDEIDDHADKARALLAKLQLSSDVLPFFERLITISTRK